MTARALNSTDVVVLDELRRLTWTVGHCSLSTRQFYELSGIGRKTIQKSLSRLASAGLARQVRTARAGASAHWIAVPADGWLVEDGGQAGVALIDPRKDAEGIIPDAFRRSDLRSPWLLYTRLPDLPLTLDEIVTICGLTTRKRTVEWWLLVLASLVPPFAVASSAERDCTWTKLPADESRLAQLAAHLEAIAFAGHGRPLHTAQYAQLRNQLEREGNVRRREAQLGY